MAMSRHDMRYGKVPIFSPTAGLSLGFLFLEILTLIDAQPSKQSASQLEIASKCCVRSGTYLLGEAFSCILRFSLFISYLNSPGQQEPGPRSSGGGLASNGYQSAIDFWADTALAPQQSPSSRTATWCGT